MGGDTHPPTPITYRRPWHYNSSTCVIPPLKWGWTLKKYPIFDAPLLFFTNSSIVYTVYSLSV